MKTTMSTRTAILASTAPAQPYQGRLSKRSPTPLFERPVTAGSHKKSTQSADFKWL